MPQAIKERPECDVYRWYPGGDNVATGSWEEAEKEVDRLFTYQPWDKNQEGAGAAVNEALKNAFKAMIQNVPPSPRRTIALQHLVDARLSANAAITFGGQY